MNLAEFNQIPYKSKKLVVSTICRMHRLMDLTRVTGVLTASEHELSDVLQANIKRSQPERSLFSSLLLLLAEPHRKIIEQEFLTAEPIDSQWYLAFWSKSAYYKLKHEAIDQFLLLLYV